MWGEFSDSEGFGIPPPKSFGLLDDPSRGKGALGEAIGFAKELRGVVLEIENPDRVAGARLGAIRRAILSTWIGDRVCLHIGQTKR